MGRVPATRRPTCTAAARSAAPRAVALAAVAAAVTALLAGGATTPARAAPPGDLDEQAGRICRSIINVLNPAGSGLDLVSTIRLGEANAVIVTYVARPATGLPRTRKLVCSFADRGTPLRRARTLVAVTSDGQTLGPARMRFLQRFWIGSSEAEAAASALSTVRKK